MIHYLTYTEPKPVGNGLVRQVFQGVPMRYLDGDKYRDVDITLSNAGATHFENVRIPYKILIPKKANGEIEYSNLKHNIVFRALCNPVEGQIKERHSVYYPDAFGEGCSLEVIALSGNVRKNIVIERRPVSIPDYLEFRFEVSANNVPLPENGKLITEQVALDGGEDNISFIRKPCAVDARNRCYDIPIYFTREGNRSYLIKRIPRRVLERCTYPLRFDDNLTVNSHTGDGYVYLASSPTWATVHDATQGTNAYPSGTGTQMYQGKSNSNWIISRSCYSFDTSALPDNITGGMISSAVLNIYCSSPANGGLTVGLCRGFIASYTTIANTDYDDIGSDATETSGRAKYTPIIEYTTRYNAATALDVAFQLNDNFKSRVNSTGYTMIGMRNAYDLDNTAPSVTTFRSVYFATAEYSSNAPELVFVYSPIADLSNAGGGIGVSGCGYYVAGGSETDCVAIVNYGSNFGGGLGIGGACTEERSVTWIEQTEPFLIGSAVSWIWSAVASSEATGYPASNLVYFNRPKRIWKSTSSLAQTIEVIFWDGIDTLALVDCNFTTFSITTVGATSSTYTCTQDLFSENLSGIALINTSGVGAKTTSKLIINIPSQTPQYSETAFRIGSVVGFKRTSLSSYPLFPNSKKLVENVVRRSFEGGVQEVEKIGRPYLMMLYSFPRTNETTFNSLQDLERLCDSGGYIFVSEMYSDNYPFRRLTQRAENFKYDLVGYRQYSVSMLLRETI